jgi:prevent-host-death family protein
MKRVAITEAKNRLSALIDRVRHGETVLILDRGRPVARLEPAQARSEDDADGKLARLERAGVIRRGVIPPPVARVLKPLPRLRRPARVVEALIAERRRGR